MRAILWGFESPLSHQIFQTIAKVAELVDALDSGSSGKKNPVGVQIPPFAPSKREIFLKTKISTLKKCKKQIVATVAKDEADKEYLLQLKRIAKYATVKGFRKGKAPLAKVESIYFDAIRDEFETKFAQKIYKKIVQEKQIFPVAPSNLTEIKWEKNKDFEATFVYETSPEIKNLIYSDIQVPFEKRHFSESDIDNQLEFLKQKAATEKEVEGSCQKDDLVKCKLNFENSKPFERELVCGQSFYGKAFDEKLTGSKKGDKFDSTIDLSEKKDASKTKKVFVEVVWIKRKFPPKIDDDFAKDAEYDSLKDMRQSIGEDLKKRLDAQNEQNLRQAIVDVLIEKNSFDLPETLVQSSMKQTMANYQKQYKIDGEQFKNIFRQMAEKNLKQGYIFEELVKILKPQVEEQDIEDFIKKDSKILQMSVSDYKSRFADFIKNSLNAKIVEDKVFEHLQKGVKIVKVPKAKKEEK